MQRDGASSMPLWVTFVSSWCWPDAHMLQRNMQYNILRLHPLNSSYLVQQTQLFVQATPSLSGQPVHLIILFLLFGLGKLIGSIFKKNCLLLSNQTDLQLSVWYCHRQKVSSLLHTRPKDKVDNCCSWFQCSRAVLPIRALLVLAVYQCPAIQGFCCSCTPACSP